ncbi:hypothetical protein [Ruegeria haliotis]|uniref:hypothetical protein n=1 Tax=Ruegeria haliotis TaxID=2747601 RepID=UPI001B7D852E|nr:hypothetical protein [Ruegeria haliotis]
MVDTSPANLQDFDEPTFETLETQIDRVYAAFEREETPLDKHVYLRGLQDDNEVLFYALLVRHLFELMPMIYTPVVGDACKKIQ